MSRLNIPDLVVDEVTNRLKDWSENVLNIVSGFI